jgi:hypothetical protein
MQSEDIRGVKKIFEKKEQKNAKNGNLQYNLDRGPLF